MNYTDQIGRTITIHSRPRRIISTVPSLTELVHDLITDHEIVGVTKFCVHPPELKKKTTVIGGTKSLKVDLICELKPDIVFANKEENDQNQIQELIDNGIKVWVSDILTVEEGIKTIVQIGDVLQVNGSLLQNKVLRTWDLLPEIGNDKSVLYFIWKAPFMVAGATTYINDVLRKLGFFNLGEEFEGRYPEIAISRFNELQPDLVLLSSEPFPFNENHIDMFREFFPQAKVLMVDGEMFSWYGSRMIPAAEYFRSLIKYVS